MSHSLIHSLIHSFVRSLIHLKLATWGTRCPEHLLTSRSTWTTPSCCLSMDVLSWLESISFLLKAHHPCTLWTQFNLGLKISSFLSPFMEGILHRGEVVLLGGLRKRDCLRWLFSPLQTLRVPLGLQSPIESMTAMLMCNSNAGFSCLSAF